MSIPNEQTEENLSSYVAVGMVIFALYNLFNALKLLLTSPWLFFTTLQGLGDVSYGVALGAIAFGLTMKVRWAKQLATVLAAATLFFCGTALWRGDASFRNVDDLTIIVFYGVLALIVLFLTKNSWLEVESDELLTRTCPACGAKNRIPVRHLTKTGRCGACRATLRASAEVGEKVEARNEVFGGAVVLTLLAVASKFDGGFHRSAPNTPASTADYGTTRCGEKLDGSPMDQMKIVNCEKKITDEAGNVIQRLRP